VKEDFEDEKEVDENFVPCRDSGLTDQEAEELLQKHGKNELAEKIIPKWLIVFRLLTGPMPMMLWIALTIEAIIGNYADMAILLGIQLINAAISFYETTKAADAVAALKASLKPKATVRHRIPHPHTNFHFCPNRIRLIPHRHVASVFPPTRGCVA
jgi:H+-transporting ATPase